MQRSEDSKSGEIEGAIENSDAAIISAEEARRQLDALKRRYARFKT
jgi:hypothetical protein